MAWGSRGKTAQGWKRMRVQENKSERVEGHPFWITTTSEWKIFKQLWLQHVMLRCSYYPVYIHRTGNGICRSPLPSQNFGPKPTTKVTQRRHPQVLRETTTLKNIFNIPTESSLASNTFDGNNVPDIPL